MTPRRTDDMLNDLAHQIHDHNAKWWVELDEILVYLPERHHEFMRRMYKAVKIALMHSELSEMLEGVRKGTMDSHLPDRPAEEVEAADLFIRLFDYIGRENLDIGGAIEAKMKYNATRADHKPEVRAGDNGKKF